MLILKVYGRKVDVLLPGLRNDYHSMFFDRSPPAAVLFELQRAIRYHPREKKFNFLPMFSEKLLPEYCNSFFQCYIITVLTLEMMQFGNWRFTYEKRTRLGNDAAAGGN